VQDRAAALVDVRRDGRYGNDFDWTTYFDGASTAMVRKKLGRGRKNRCRFCTKEGCPRPAFVDYKDVQTLKKLCTSQGKLFSRKRSGNCAAFQRAVKDAVKRARFMALLPYVGE
jgi:small subunit ribosomal protein S18